MICRLCRGCTTAAAPLLPLLLLFRFLLLRLDCGCRWLFTRRRSSGRSDVSSLTIGLRCDSAFERQCPRECQGGQLCGQRLTARLGGEQRGVLRGQHGAKRSEHITSGDRLGTLRARLRVGYAIGCVIEPFE